MKFKLTLFFCIAIAAILGALLGGLASTSTNAYLHWLGFSKAFGFDTIELNLHIIRLSFGLHVDINITQILLVIVAIAVSPKVAASIKTS